MSKLLKDTFTGLFKVGATFIKPKMLRKESGARFSTTSELNSLFSSRNNGILIDGHKMRLNSKVSYEHIAVIAKPGSGKTTAYIIPNILELANSNSSIVVNDPSKEVFDLTSGYMQEKGFTVLRLNPDDLSQSSCFNPFNGLDARHEIQIEQICASIIMSKYGTDKDPIWNEGAVSILEVIAKCLAYSQSHNFNLGTINSLVQQIGSDGKGLNDWVAENSIHPLTPQDDSLARAWYGLISSNDKMFSSYLTICKTALKQLNNAQIRELLSKNDIFFEDFRKEKTIVYLNFPEAQQSYYQFIIDVFYSRLFAAFMESKPKKGEFDLYCFLDEFGSAYVNDFHVIINNVRKYKVSLSIVLQGIAQLATQYGENKAKTIRSGIGSSLIFKGADHSTATEFSNILGSKIISQKENFTDVIEHVNERGLLTADQIRTMADNQAVFISKNRHPAIIEFVPYYNNGKYKKLTKLSPFQGAGKVTLDFDTKLRL